MSNWPGLPPKTSFKVGDLVEIVGESRKVAKWKGRQARIVEYSADIDEYRLEFCRPAVQSDRKWYEPYQLRLVSLLDVMISDA